MGLKVLKSYEKNIYIKQSWYSTYIHVLYKNFDAIWTTKHIQTIL